MAAPPVAAGGAVSSAGQSLAREGEVSALDTPSPETDSQARPLYDEAVALAAARKHRKAIAAYRACLEVEPNHTLARLGLCESLLAIGDRESAKAEAVPLQELVPRDQPTWRRASAILQKMDDCAGAEILTRRFIAETGGTPEARIELVEIQPMQAGRPHDRIEADLAEALRHPAEEVQFWRRVGKQQRRLQHLDRALDAIEHALRIEPNDFGAHCDRVETLVRQDNAKLARRRLAEMLPYVPDGPQELLQIAEIATEANDTEVARYAIDRAMAAIEPKWHELRLRLVRVMQINDDPRAIEVVRDLTAVCENPHILRRLFNICYEKGQGELALAIGEKLQRLGPAGYEITTGMDGLRFVRSRQQQAAVRTGGFAPRHPLLRRLFGGGGL